MAQYRQKAISTFTNTVHMSGTVFVTNTLSASAIEAGNMTYHTSMIATSDISGSGFLNIVGGIETQGNVGVTGSLTVSGSIYPSTAGTSTLGKQSNKWATLYVNDISGSGKILNVGGIETEGNLGVTGSAVVSGSLGIGAASTGAALYLKAEDARVRVDSDPNGTPGIELSRVGTRKWVIYDHETSDNLDFKTDSDIRMSIEQDGNVGIGTDSPNCMLHVAGAAAFSGPSETFVTFSSSDGTPSVATGNLFKTHASGQTLTMFDDGVAGQIINVISTAAVVYDVTGTNLKGGSADITTASGDVTTWVFDGTNWYLLNFMDVSADLSGGH